MLTLFYFILALNATVGIARCGILMSSLVLTPPVLLSLILNTFVLEICIHHLHTLLWKHP